MEESKVSEQTPKEVPTKKTKKKLPIKKILLVLLALFVLIGSNFAVYYRQQQEAKKQATDYQNQIKDLEAKNAQLQKELEDSKKTSQASQQKDLTVSPTAEDLENIEAAITSKNYAALEGYMADTVTVILAASEGIGPRTPAQAIADMNYLSGGTNPWNFALPAATITAWESGDYATYIKSAVLVGKSANDYVVALKFNTSGEITDVFMTNSADLL